MYPFKEGSFAVRNGWYVAAFASDLTEKPIARTILGMPVALYRRRDGRAVAVGGRCPHRNFPLGEGRVNGDEIVCGYHGIAFGADGRCTRIPSQETVPERYRIPTYPLVEHGMWLWIWPGDPLHADPSLLPDLAEIGYVADENHTAALFTHFVKCRYQLLNDNLLDLTHLAILHGTSIGTMANATVPEEVTKESRVLRSRRYIKSGAPTPHLVKTHGITGPVDSVIGMDFYLPGFHAGIGDHFHAAENPELAGKPIQLGRVFHAVTPVTGNTSYYFFGMTSMSAIRPELVRAGLAPVIAEDIFASEEIEKMIALMGGNPDELMIKSDRTAVTGRRMLQAMMDAEQADAEHTVIAGGLRPI